MKMPEVIDNNMLAPCGINCKVCYKHLHPKKSCQGCFLGEENKPEHCKKCAIIICEKRKGIKYCYECEDFPCKRMKYQEKSYSTRYKVSPFQNLSIVKKLGIHEFMKTEKVKWTCPNCEGIVSQHDRICSECKMKQEGD